LHALKQLKHKKNEIVIISKIKIIKAIIGKNLIIKEKNRC